MNIIDIGANIGAHALPLAKNVLPYGRVVAIEPTDWAFDKLKKNKSLNPDLSDILILKQAALLSSDKERPASFYASWKVSSNVGDDVHGVHGGTSCEATRAEVLTLDDLVEERGLTHVDIIKLDVDGYEYQVLEGAKKTLADKRPYIVMELCEYVHTETNSTLFKVVELLYAGGYELFSLEKNRKRLPSDYEALRKLIPQGGGINALAVPMPITTTN